MVDVGNAGFVVFGVAILLRISCGSFIRRGSKWDDSVESFSPVAARWFKPRVVSGGAISGAVLMIVAAGLLIASFLGIDAV